MIKDGRIDLRYAHYHKNNVMLSFSEKVGVKPFNILLCSTYSLKESLYYIGL